MPDQLIQAPASTQNYNRYSYCLNNPLKYTDASGEVVWLVGGGISSFGYDILDGGSLEDAFTAGGVGALSGAITGGVIGSSAEGIKALKEGRSFWTGELPGPSNNYSSLRLEDDFGIKKMNLKYCLPKKCLTPSRS